MFDIEKLKSRIDSFPSRYMKNFDYVWKWKIRIESNGSANIFDDKHRGEAYRRLCTILPKWQTYRNGDNADPLRTLKESLANISEAYNQLRTYTMLDFDSIPFETLETVWHELGRVKEYNGKRNEYGPYSIISVCKPLLLIWGQTLAFDSFVRKHIPRSYRAPRYSNRWSLDEWMRVMKEFSECLKKDRKTLEFIGNESEEKYGKDAIIPYGRFLDVYYWKGP